jgi:hypothetical protein
MVQPPAPGRPPRRAAAAPQRLEIELLTSFTLANNPGVSRWLPGERPVVGATVRLQGTQVSARTNANGLARLAMRDVGVGVHVLEITPAAAQLSPGPAGPAHGNANFNASPQMQLRPFEVEVSVDNLGFQPVPAPRILTQPPANVPIHALVFSVTPRRLRLDWKPDWIKSSHRRAAPG